MSEDHAAPNRGFITLCVMLATVMQAIDTTIANVALPYMQGSLSANLDQINWVLTSYIVAAAIMTPPTGYLATRFGHKRLFLVSVAGFTVASMLCGLATSLTEVVLFRLLQGVCGAALVPLSQSVLLDTYPREQHGSAMALWGIGVMVGPILGPTLGGYLTENFSWRWVFFINLPIGVLTLVGMSVFLRETRRDVRARFDWFGFGALSLAIAALQLLLDRGQHKDWFGSPEIVAEAVLAALGMCLFLAHTFTAERPFIDPRMFVDRNFSSGLALIFVVGVALYATLALLSPFLQELMSYPVMTAGFLLAPRGVGTMAAMFVVGRLINRIDMRMIIGFGFALMAVSMWQMAGFTADVPQGAIVSTGLIQGLGMGCVFVPLSTITFSTLTPALRTQGTALYSLLRNVGASAGISLVITLLARNTQTVHATLAQYVSVFNPQLGALAGNGFAGLGRTAALAALNAEVTRQANAIAYLDDFRLMMLLTLAAMPLVLLLREPRALWRAEPVALE